MADSDISQEQLILSAKAASASRNPYLRFRAPENGDKIDSMNEYLAWGELAALSFERDNENRILMSQEMGMNDPAWEEALVQIRAQQKLHSDTAIGFLLEHRQEFPTEAATESKQWKTYFIETRRSEIPEDDKVREGNEIITPVAIAAPTAMPIEAAAAIPAIEAPVAEPAAQPEISRAEKIGIGIGRALRVTVNIAQALMARFKNGAKKNSENPDELRALLSSGVVQPASRLGVAIMTMLNKLWGTKPPEEPFEYKEPKFSSETPAPQNVETPTAPTEVEAQTAAPSPATAEAPTEAPAKQSEQKDVTAAVTPTTPTAATAPAQQPEQSNATAPAAPATPAAATAPAQQPQQSNATAPAAPTAPAAATAPAQQPVPKNTTAAKVIAWGKRNGKELVVGAVTGASVRVGVQFGLAALATTAPAFGAAVAASPLATAVVVAAIAGGITKLIRTKRTDADPSRLKWAVKTFATGALHGALGGAIGAGIADWFSDHSVLHGLFDKHIAPPDAVPPEVAAPIVAPLPQPVATDMLSAEQLKALSPELQKMATSKNTTDVLFFCKEASYEMLNGHDAAAKKAGAQLLEFATKLADENDIHSRLAEKLHADAAYVKAWGIGTTKDVPLALDHAHRAGTAVHNYGAKLIALLGPKP